MLYTTMPFEAVFPPDPVDPAYLELLIDGRLCLIRQCPDGTRRLERLLSTNPQDYLDARYNPNSIISL